MEATSMFCRAVDNLVHRNIMMFDLGIQVNHLYYISFGRSECCTETSGAF